MKFFVIAFTAALLTYTSAVAQKFLAIDKSGKVKRLRFYVNDKINIRIQDENFFRSGHIDAIEDTSFIFEGAHIPLSRVDAILVYHNKGGSPFLKELSIKLPIGAVFLLAITAINSAINSSYPLIPTTMYIITGTMVATGLILYPLTFSIYKTTKHPLKIIDVTIGEKD
jgi:hypothetical protein